MRTADRLAGWFIALVLGLAVVTWVVWHGRDPARALDSAIALLIVTCPCALALATPLAISVAIGRAARDRILIRGGDALEVLAKPCEILLDKTGTLTEGRMALIEWHGPERARSVVLALERHSSHPIARAFESAWRSVTPVDAEEVQHHSGGGLSGNVGRQPWLVGSPGFVLARAHDLEHLADRIPAHLTPVLAAEAGVVVGAAGLGDPIRPEARETIAILENRGWTVGILSGDTPGVVAAVGRFLGISPERIEGGASPERKLAVVRERVSRGRVVMVGDGVNDAPAIGAASAGIGVRGGAEACLAAADVFLARQGLEPLARLMEGSARTMRVIRRNIAVSLGYNVIGAGLAMTGAINPLLAAVLMPASSLSVTILSWRSRTFDPPGT